MKPELASLLCVVGILFVVACSDDEGPTEPEANPPQPTNVSESVASPGDTLIITGSNFTTPANTNQVRFANPLGVSTAFAGDENQIEVVVDQDAVSGAITVTNAGGSGTGPVVTIPRNIGDFFVFGGLGPNNVLSLPNPTATTQYLIIPHGTNASAPYATDYGYSIESANTITTASMTAATRGPRRELAASPVGIREAFDSYRWEQTEELVRRVGVPRREPEPRDAPAATAPPYKSFYVLNTADPDDSVLDPGNYDRITADLRYTGTKCLVYADVDTLADPTDNFDTAHFRQFGQAFDNSIEATNVSYFGPYSDVDNNDKVIILISPVVNRLTPPGSGGFIAGFFLGIDLYAPGQVPSGTTNHAEIFYLLAADPDEFWGNPFPVDFTAEENIGTTAHEHEHMISYSHRIFYQDGVTQVTWLEEGMAHLAEDLNGMHDANQGRADRYLQNPGAISLEDARANLEQRGGIYLFLRLLADRYGTDILKDIVQSKCSGRTCIQNVTGKGFYDLVAEFFAALYLTGRGITLDRRFNYTSIDLADYGTLTTYTGLVGLDSAGDVRRSSGDFYLYNGALGVDTRFTFYELIPGIRLRHAIVRVQ